MVHERCVEENYQTVRVETQLLDVSHQRCYEASARKCRTRAAILKAIGVSLLRTDRRLFIQ